MRHWRSRSRAGPPLDHFIRPTRNFSSNVLASAFHPACQRPHLPLGVRRRAGRQPRGQRWRDRLRRRARRRAGRGADNRSRRIDRDPRPDRRAYPSLRHCVRPAAIVADAARCRDDRRGPDSRLAAREVDRTGRMGVRCRARRERPGRASAADPQRARHRRAASSGAAAPLLRPRCGRQQCGVAVLRRDRRYCRSRWRRFRPHRRRTARRHRTRERSRDPVSRHPAAGSRSAAAGAAADHRRQRAHGAHGRRGSRGRLHHRFRRRVFDLAGVAPARRAAAAARLHAPA